MTSREMEVNAIGSAQMEQQYEEQAIQEMTHWQAQGIGMATFCQAFYDAMQPQEGDDDTRFDRSEILALLHTALGGMK